MLFYKLVSIMSYFLFVPVFLFITSLLLIISIIHTPAFYKLDKLCCRIIMSTLFIWPNIRGSFPKKGTYIIMMNHSSFVDVFLFPLVPSGHYSGITAKQNFKIPIFSNLIRKLQAIPIDRSNLESAIKSIKRAEHVLKQGIHIGILPEGTRTLTGAMSPLKKGGFHMALNAGVSIVPVGIKGAFSFKPKNRWWIKPGPISINIGKLIPVQNFSKEDIDILCNHVNQKIKDLSGENNENK
mgnify:CR=1 FL=1